MFLVSMFVLLSGVLSTAGVAERAVPWASADAAALKSIRAKKQLATQPVASFMGQCNEPGAPLSKVFNLCIICASKFALFPMAK